MVKPRAGNQFAPDLSSGLSAYKRGTRPCMREGRSEDRQGGAAGYGWRAAGV
jgi:hypothetical protein